MSSQRGAAACDAEGLLDHLRAARRKLIEQQAAWGRRSGVGYCAQAIVDQIDEMALILKGDRTFLHEKGHGKGDR